MNSSTLKKSLTSKLLIFVLPLLLALGVAAPSAQARDYHHHGYRHAYRHGYYGGRGYYRHRGYGDHYRHGYWRHYHGRRYWYEDGGYFLSPGGVSINIGL